MGGPKKKYWQTHGNKYFCTTQKWSHNQKLKKKFYTKETWKHLIKNVYS